MASRAYSPKTFFRRIPSQLFRQFLEQRGLLASVTLDWSTLKEGDADAFFRALQALPATVLAQVEGEFRLINELATNAGTHVLIEQAECTGHAWGPILGPMSSPYERAMWAYLKGRAIFETAVECATLDRVGSWDRRVVAPFIEVKIDDLAKDALAAAVQKVFLERGCGRYCHVDSYDRLNPERHCFHVYPEGFATTDPGYSDDGRFEMRARRAALEVIFVYRPQEGVVELHTKGNREIRDQLFDAFARTIRGLEAMPDADSQKPLQLDVFKDPSFTFPLMPSDGVEEVHLVAMKLAASGRRARFISWSVPTRGIPIGELRNWILESLNQSNVPLTRLFVTLVKLKFILPRDPTSRRERSITCELSLPHRTTLKDDPEDQLARNCLRRWGIYGAGAA
jgi:hypothetical protein